MNRLLLICLLVLSNSALLFSQISMNPNGSPPHPSAGLDVNFDDRGFLLPRMTFDQRNLIEDPAEGLMIYCTDCGTDALGALSIYQNGVWRNINLDCSTPPAPEEGTHVPALTQITWNWNAVPIALGYKFNTVNNFETATEMGTNTSFTETGLTCWTDYTRYIWAYNECGPSGVTILTSATTQTPFSPAPTPFVQFPGPFDILWSWYDIPTATGYLWNTVNDPETAIDLGDNLTYHEFGLDCQAPYTRYVWAYNNCGHSVSTELFQYTTSNPPAAPAAGTHVANITQIVWNWNTVSGATGYKWGVTNIYGDATDMGTLTAFTETGLACNTPYTRYVWAYGDCGYSTPTQLNQSTLTDPPAAPVAATHVPSAYQVVWNWNPVAGATGYKWHTSNNPGAATDLGNVVTYTETGLNCNTAYTRYVWAYSPCGTSAVTNLTETTLLDPPASPLEATHTPSPAQIIWDWDPVTGATGYKWHTSNIYASATDLGNVTTYSESNLNCNTPYVRYVWAYSSCGVSDPTTLSETTSLDPPATPVAGTHVAGAYQITWNWNSGSSATGYKWNTENNYGSADDLGTNTSKLETGLNCNTPYTRYVWAYSNCGVSGPLTMNQSTSLDPPASPTAGTHVAAVTQITWNWNTVAGATGYKWHTSNNYTGATDLGNVLTTTETGLTCNSPYQRYVWAYSSCGVSTPTTLNQSTNPDPPAAPVAGTHVPSPTQIAWNWEAVTGATGYRWSANNNYTNATDLGNVLTTTETGLTCNTPYTRYLWAYGPCGVSIVTELNQSTALDPPATPAAGTHVATNSQITWNWNTVSGATGYRWNDEDDYENAEELGANSSFTQTGLVCGTSYTSYVWAYSPCGVSAAGSLTQSTTTNPPAAPAAGSHVAAAYQVEWKWNAVSGATGYKWSANNDFITATDVGTALFVMETGLDCNTGYTRYVWAYDPCSNSTVTTLNATTAMSPPATPTPGAHVPALTQIEWKWNAVATADGYKWHTANDYDNAEDMFDATSKTETGLTCNTPYTRYVWAYSNCGVSGPLTVTQSTAANPPAAPVAGTHTATIEQIVWAWNTVEGATGYKWNTSNNYGSAQEMGTNTSKTENGLTCNTFYTRYVWAYGPCGYSAPTTLNFSTLNEAPATPGEGAHTASASMIVWRWTAVTGAIEYKWNSSNTFSTATSVGTSLSYAQNSLSCNTPYSSYVWAVNACGNSVPAELTATTTSDPPSTPTAGTHSPQATQITWVWNTVPGAAGYKWNTENNYSTAFENGTSTNRVETGLTCGTSYTRYAWAYNACGQSTPLTMTQSTQACFACGQNINAVHIAGNVAPVNKTTTYGTVTNVPGEPTKCWITKNLGSDRQATTVGENTEAPAGWYWQFNLKQGYKHDGTTRTPNTTWITYIEENSDWLPANDPCSLLLGDGWRLPTKMEWINVSGTSGGNWGTWTGAFGSPLKLHAAGRIYYSTGNLNHRGTSGNYWSSTQANTIWSFLLNFTSGGCGAISLEKTWGYSARCIRD